MARSTPSVRARCAVYIAALLGINFFIVRDLFFVDYTDNMQTNAGAFMAISRFLVKHWPHVAWYPWWFNGEPFQNSYSPLLIVADAALAWITGASVSRVYNFVTALLYVLGPVFLFVFAWRVSRRLETSFCAALIYSLFSPSNLLGTFRTDAGGLWNPWRLRTLVYYGEGPHHAVASLLPLVLLLLYKALTTRRFAWCAGAAASAALLTLTNTFGAIDLVIACGCLIAVFPPKQMGKMAALVCAIGVASYVWASPLMPPSLLRTVSEDSQRVEGDFAAARLLPALVFIVAGFVCLWFATEGRIRDRFTRFAVLFAYVFGAIVAYNAIWNIAVLPQPHRYALEMELAVALGFAFTVRGVVVRFPAGLTIAVALLCGVFTAHQLVQYRAWAREHIQKFDVTRTPDYQAAKWMEANLPGERIFAGGETATWLDVFADIPQMHSGHEPFNPNLVERGATYAIYTGQNAGSRDTATSILWLKAFGCHAILVGPSRYYGEVFADSYKFDGTLEVLWHAGRFTLYGVPYGTKSLAHVVPAEAIVINKPINGLDTDEVERYVAALDDPSLPKAQMTWPDPTHASIQAFLRTGDVVSIQSTFDRGWRATANGKPTKTTRDGIGLTVAHPDCDGPCSIDFVYAEGTERSLCCAASVTITCAALGGFLLKPRRVRETAPFRDRPRPLRAPKPAATPVALTSTEN